MLAGVPLLQRLRAHLEPLGLAPAEVLALLVLLVGAMALTGVVWWTNRVPAGPPLADGLAALDGAEPAVGDPPGPAPVGSAPSEAGPVVVHVAGEVVRPGLVTLPSGSRVGDAVQAVGGVTGRAVLDGVNLARTLVDGEQVRVPGPDDPTGDPVQPGSPVAAEQQGPLDLNAATAADLESIPGVGPVTAQRIIAHRESLGGFADVTQLLEVPGIGPARFAEIEPRVRV